VSPADQAGRGLFGSGGMGCSGTEAGGRIFKRYGKKILFQGQLPIDK